MLVEQDGKYRTVRTPGDVHRILKASLSGLGPDEREYIDAVLLELEETGESVLLDGLMDLEYEEMPVSMAQFLEDPYYLGTACRTLYPMLRRHLIEIFDEGDYQEIVATGSIGYGKTFLATIALIRSVYELLCLRDPQASLGLAPKSVIAVVNITVSVEAAMKVLIENVWQKIEDSPFFKERFPPSKTRQEIRFAKNIWMAAKSSGDNSVLGLNVVSAIVDETNFLGSSEKEGSPGQYESNASKIYNSLMVRMKSRYMMDGRLPGKILLVSSRSDPEDFTEQRIREGRLDPTVYVVDHALWDVKRENFSRETFPVEIGNEKVPPRVIKPEERKLFEDQGIKVIDVPMDFRSDFTRDIYRSLRDIAGEATLALKPFITDYMALERALQTGRVHPFSLEEFQVGGPGSMDWSLLVWENDEGGEEPILNPDAFRHVHIDPALSADSAGFAMGHVSGVTEVARRTPTGEVVKELAPLITIDFMLAVRPPEFGQIQLRDLRQMVYMFAKHGYPITTVTLDSYQSVDSIQTLTRKGYTARVESMDVNSEPYATLRDAIYDDRLSGYPHATLRRELEQLEEDRKRRKVDHPKRKGASKDVSDAVAGVVWTLTKKFKETPLPAVMGLSEYPGQKENTMMKQIVGKQKTRPAPAEVPDDEELPAFLIG